MFKFGLMAAALVLAAGATHAAPIQLLYETNYDSGAFGELYLEGYASLADFKSSHRPAVLTCPYAIGWRLLTA